MKQFLVTLTTVLIMATPLWSQDKPKGFITADLVSHYMWRGQDKGNACIQPKLGVKWKGFRLALEGSGGFSNDDYEELDIVLTYKYRGFTFGLYDEWGEDWMESPYFKYGHETTHQFSAHVGYAWDWASANLITTFAGADYKPNGSRAYSTYIELNVPFHFATLDWEASVGLTPYESGGLKTQPKDEIELFEYAYADCFAVNKLSLHATKVFSIKNYELPVYIEVQGNPWRRVANIILGITFINL